MFLFYGLHISPIIARVTNHCALSPKLIFLCSVWFIIVGDIAFTIELTKAVVMPVAWIPDIYVNPSNNGNLQSSYANDLDKAVRRTNAEFIVELNKEIAVALEKKKNKK